MLSLIECVNRENQNEKGSLGIIFVIQFLLFCFAAFPSVTIEMMKKQITITGRITNFTCQGKGKPRPTLAWYKSGQKITNSSRVTLSSSAFGDKLVTSELVIIDTKYEDSVVYTCVIDNTVGVINSSGILIVHGRLMT